MKIDQESYPLGHSTTEMGRLEIQAKLFEDPLLLELAKKAESCLEIGAGIGSNLPSLQKVNPGLKYEGVDLSPSAIAMANTNHGGRQATFSIANAAALPFNTNSLDLVFSKLVLWSMGPSWMTALTEAFRVLRPGGVFYAFEPYDNGVILEPPRPAFQEVLQHWGYAASQKGIDLCIGPKVASEFTRVGFKNVQTIFFPVLALESGPDRFHAVCDNLVKFYFGESSRDFLKELDPLTLVKAKEELQATPQGLVMDAFFVTIGKKLIE